jgi:fibronectin type 3 domain-containing protein/predicted RNA-binding protein with TRAM domain
MILLPLLLVLGLGTPVARPAAAAVPATMSAAELTTMFATYGNQGGHWTGADSTTSVPLPDGRIAWLFSDTFLGTVNPDFSRPPGTPMVHNTIVVQDGTAPTQTIYGGTASAPKAVVEATDPADMYWVGDGTVAGGALKVFYNRYHRTGDGPLDFTLAGTALVTFALPALTVSSVQPLPLGATIGWGSAVLDDGGYTYVYGTESAGSLKFAHLARTPLGLSGAWEFWTGSGWSSSESASTRLMSGVGTAFSVDKIGSQYVLVTQDADTPFSPSIVAHVAPAPTGPFDAPRYLFDAPEPGNGKQQQIYDPRTHPELAANGKLLISYNVNSLDNAQNFADARIYRARFTEVAWPPAAPGTGPAAPSGLTLTGTGSPVTVSWQPVAGATSYRLYRRDVTHGQTYFSRMPASYTATTTDLGFLEDGVTYEFKVAAVNSAGEGPSSAVASVTVHVVPPPAPANLQATANGAGGVALTWAPVPVTARYSVYLRDVTAGQTDFTPVAVPDPLATSAIAPDLASQHVYEFKVTASNGGGESGPSNLVQATARYDKPLAPGGLTATADGLGAVQLSWSAPPGRNWYWIYERDVTAGETNFTQMTYPVTDGTTAKPGGFLNGHEYEFAVSAINAGGEGPRSAPARATIRYDKPGAPSGLTATANNDGSVSLQWTAPSPGDNLWYWIYQRDVTAGETAFTKLEYPITDGTSFRPGYLMAGHEYEFQVAAINAGGDGPVSAPARATARYDKPPAPTGLTATPGDGQVSLAWTAPGPDLWYWIYYRDTTAGETNFTQAQYPITDGTTATLGLLANGHTYEFKVSAVNAGGEGAAGAVVTAKPLPPLPAKVTGLAAAPQADGTVKLTWTAQNAVYYWVYYRDSTAGGAYTKLPYPSAEPSTTVGLLTNGHRYDFKVAATNLAGDGPDSDVVGAVASVAVPGAPANLTGIAAGDGSVDLAWDSAGPNMYYWMYRRDVTAGETAFTKALYPIDQTSASWEGLQDSHVYEFQVRAENAGGLGAPSNTVSVTAHGGLPAPPTNLRLTPGNGQIVVNWTASTTPDVYYWVYYRDASTGESFRKLSVPFSGTTATLSPLTNGHTYEVKVATTNWAGDSKTTPVASARPLPPVPAAPSLTAIAGNGEVGLGWQGAEHATAFRVEYRDTTAGQQGWTQGPAGINAYAVTVRPLANGHRYEFRVFGNNVAGESAPSNVVAATPVPPPPSAPSNLRATAGNSQVTLSWNASPTPDVYYWVYFRPQGQSAWYNVATPVRGTSFVHKPLFNGFSVEYKVTAANLGGQSGFSNTVSATPFLPIPAAPSGLTAVAGDRQVSLSWNASPSPNVYYWVYYRPQGQSVWLYHPKPVYGTSFVHTGQWNGFTIEYKVTAANAAGQSGFSNTVSARPLPPLPAKPTMRAFPIARTGMVRTEWESPYSDGLYFQLQHRGPSTSNVWVNTYAPIIANPGTSSYFAEVPETSLLPFQDFDFRVIAHNLAGETISDWKTAKAWPNFASVYVDFTGPTSDSYAKWAFARNNDYWSLYHFDWSTDGCSVPGVPGTWADFPLAFNFRPYCMRHDFGYRNHYTAGLDSQPWFHRINATMYWDLRRMCDAQSWWQRGSCYALASTYSLAVENFAQDAWNSGGH